MKPYLLILTLLSVFGLTACGQLEFGIETKVTAGRPIVTTQVVATQVVVATATSQPTLSTPTPVASLTPTAIATDLPTSTSIPTQPPTAVPTHTPVPRPFNTATSTPAATPQIYRFTATPLSVQPGAALALNWDASGEQATICVGFGHEPYYDCRDVWITGTTSWLLQDYYRSDINVQLRVIAAGKTATAVVPIHIACDDDWWFFSPAPTLCPIEPATTSDAAAQYFEEGWMLWVDKMSAIYAFFEDGSYAVFYDPLVPGEPEEGDGGVTPPTGFVAPIRGFGLVWRGEAYGAEGGWVRERLGWGLAPEFAFETQYQWDVGVSPQHYFRDADGRIIGLDQATSRWYVYNDIE